MSKLVKKSLILGFIILALGFTFWTISTRKCTERLPIRVSMNNKNNMSQLEKGNIEFG